MPAFAYADHALVVKAQKISNPWYEPHPGIRQHDHTMAHILTQHISDIDPELIAAALISHSFALVPEEVGIEEFLTTHLNERIAGIVASLENEYDAMVMRHSTMWEIYVHMLIQLNPAAALLSTVDKIVVLKKLSQTTLDLAEYSSNALPVLKAYYQLFHHHAAPHLPVSLADELAQLITTIPV